MMLACFTCLVVAVVAFAAAVLTAQDPNGRGRGFIAFAMVVAIIAFGGAMAAFTRWVVA